MADCTDDTCIFPKPHDAHWESVPKPAQSDAPSAAIEPPFITFLVKEWLPQNSPRKTRLVDMNATETVIAAEAYAALRTAQQQKNYYDIEEGLREENAHLLALNAQKQKLLDAFADEGVQDEIFDANNRTEKAEAKVAQLERERDAYHTQSVEYDNRAKKSAERAEAAESALSAKELELDTLSNAHRQVAGELARVGTALSEARERIVQECIAVAERLSFQEGAAVALNLRALLIR